MKECNSIQGFIWWIGNIEIRFVANQPTLFCNPALLFLKKLCDLEEALNMFHCFTAKVVVWTVDTGYLRPTQPGNHRVKRFYKTCWSTVPGRTRSSSYTAWSEPPICVVVLLLLFWSTYVFHLGVEHQWIEREQLHEVYCCRHIEWNGSEPVRGGWQLNHYINSEAPLADEQKRARGWL